MDHTLWRLCLLASLTVSAFSGPAYFVNLVQNPSADSGLQHWSTSTFTTYSSGASYSTAFCSFPYFGGGKFSTASASQSIDISGYPSNTVFTWKAALGDYSDDDTARYTIEAYAGSYTTIVNTGNYTQTTWKMFEGVFTKPSGATQLRLTMHSYRNSGSDCDGYIDCLSVSASQGTPLCSCYGCHDEALGTGSSSLCSDCASAGTTGSSVSQCSAMECPALSTVNATAVCNTVKSTVPEQCQVPQSLSDYTTCGGCVYNGHAWCTLDGTAGSGVCHNRDRSQSNSTSCASSSLCQAKPECWVANPALPTPYGSTRSLTSASASTTGSSCAYVRPQDMQTCSQCAAVGMAWCGVTGTCHFVDNQGGSKCATTQCTDAPYDSRECWINPSNARMCPGTTPSIAVNITTCSDCIGQGMGWCAEANASVQCRSKGLHGQQCSTQPQCKDLCWKTTDAKHCSRSQPHTFTTYDDCISAGHGWCACDNGGAGACYALDNDGGPSCVPQASQCAAGATPTNNLNCSATQCSSGCWFNGSQPTQCQRFIPLNAVQLTTCTACVGQGLGWCAAASTNVSQQCHRKGQDSSQCPQGECPEKCWKTSSQRCAASDPGVHNTYTDCITAGHGWCACDNGGAGACYALDNDGGPSCVPQASQCAAGATPTNNLNCSATQCSSGCWFNGSQPTQCQRFIPSNAASLTTCAACVGQGLGWCAAADVNASQQCHRKGQDSSQCPKSACPDKCWKTTTATGQHCGASDFRLQTTYRDCMAAGFGWCACDNDGAGACYPVDNSGGAACVAQTSACATNTSCFVSGATFTRNRIAYNSSVQAIATCHDCTSKGLGWCEAYQTCMVPDNLHGTSRNCSQQCWKPASASSAHCSASALPPANFSSCGGCLYHRHGWCKLGQNSVDTNLQGQCVGTTSTGQLGCGDGASTSPCAAAPQCWVSSSAVQEYGSVASFQEPEKGCGFVNPHRVRTCAACTRMGYGWCGVTSTCHHTDPSLGTSCTSTSCASNKFNSTCWKVGNATGCPDMRVASFPTCKACLTNSTVAGTTGWLATEQRCAMYPCAAQPTVAACFKHDASACPTGPVCSSFTECSTCLSQSSCGWCATTSTCMETAQQTSTVPGTNNSTTSTVPCSACPSGFSATQCPVKVCGAAFVGRTISLDCSAVTVPAGGQPAYLTAIAGALYGHASPEAPFAAVGNCSKPMPLPNSCTNNITRSIEMHCLRPLGAAPLQRCEFVVSDALVNGSTPCSVVPRWASVVGVCSVNAVAVHSMTPQFGPSTGGTSVTLTGKNFSPGSSASCRIGGNLVPATVHSTTTVTCKTSPLQSSTLSAIPNGTMHVSTVELVVEGIALVVPSNVTFHFYLPEAITSSSPTTPVATTSVRFTGINLFKPPQPGCTTPVCHAASTPSTAMCQFTLLYPVLPSNPSVVTQPASFVAGGSDGVPGTIECVAPLGARGTVYALRVANDGVHYPVTGFNVTLNSVCMGPQVLYTDVSSTTYEDHSLRFQSYAPDLACTFVIVPSNEATQPLAMSSMAFPSSLNLRPKDNLSVYLYDVSTNITGALLVSYAGTQTGGPALPSVVSVMPQRGLLLSWTSPSNSGGFQGALYSFAIAVSTVLSTPPPTKTPTQSPSLPPTASPTGAPTLGPTPPPTLAPTAAPTTGAPTHAPVPEPTLSPTLPPTLAPTAHPTLGPTAAPTRDCGAGQVRVNSVCVCNQGYWDIQLANASSASGTSGTAQRCQACTAGKFGNAVNSSHCSMCPVGHFCPHDALAAPMPCEAGYMCSTSGAQAEAPCAAGSMSVASSTSCNPCPAGYHNSREASTRCYECINKDMCAAGGKCLEDRTGNLCGRCKAGMFELDGRCFQCAGTVLPTLIAAGVVVIFVYLIYRVSIAVKDNRVLLLKLAASFVQLLAFAVGIYALWPDEVMVVFGYLKVFTLSVDFINPECYLEWNWYWKMVSALIIPLLFCTVALLYDAYLNRQRKNLQHDRTIGTSEKRVRRKKFRQRSFAVRSVLILAIVTVYSPVLGMMLSIFRPCVDSEQGKVMVTDPSLKCYTGLWVFFVLYALAIGLVLGVGVPLFIFLKARRFARSEMAEQGQMRKLYQHLFDWYHDDALWFEAFLLVRKAIMLVVLVFTPDATLSATLNLLVTVAYGVVLHITQPYHPSLITVWGHTFDMYHGLDMLTTVALALTYIVAIMLSTGGLNGVGASVLFWLLNGTASAAIFVFWWSHQEDGQTKGEHRGLELHRLSRMSRASEDTLDTVIPPVHINTLYEKFRSKQLRDPDAYKWDADMTGVDEDEFWNLMKCAKDLHDALHPKDKGNIQPQYSMVEQVYFPRLEKERSRMISELTEQSRLFVMDAMHEEANRVHMWRELFSPPGQGATTSELSFTSLVDARSIGSGHTDTDSADTQLLADSTDSAIPLLGMTVDNEQPGSQPLVPQETAALLGVQEEEEVKSVEHSKGHKSTNSVSTVESAQLYNEAVERANRAAEECSQILAEAQRLYSGQDWARSAEAFQKLDRSVHLSVRELQVFEVAAADLEAYGRALRIRSLYDPSVGVQSKDKARQQELHRRDMREYVQQELAREPVDVTARVEALLSSLLAFSKDEEVRKNARQELCRALGPVDEKSLTDAHSTENRLHSQLQQQSRVVQSLKSSSNREEVFQQLQDNRDFKTIMDVDRERRRLLEGLAYANSGVRLHTLQELVRPMVAVLELCAAHFHVPVWGMDLVITELRKALIEQVSLVHELIRRRNADLDIEAAIHLTSYAKALTQALLNMRSVVDKTLTAKVEAFLESTRELDTFRVKKTQPDSKHFKKLHKRYKALRRERRTVLEIWHSCLDNVQEAARTLRNNPKIQALIDSDREEKKDVGAEDELQGPLEEVKQRHAAMIAAFDSNDLNKGTQLSEELGRWWTTTLCRFYELERDAANHCRFDRAEECVALRQQFIANTPHSDTSDFPEVMWGKAQPALEQLPAFDFDSAKRDLAHNVQAIVGAPTGPGA